MNGKRIHRYFPVLLALALMAGCSLPGTPVGVPQNPQPGQSTQQPEQPIPTQTALQARLPSLFKMFRSVAVTPAGNLIGGAFVRIGYVPGKDRLVVTFSAKLDQPEGGCTDGYGYAYREYNRDMVETGDNGVISCFAATDTGGLFEDDDFYLASMGHDNATGKDGWHLTKYDAVTWKTLVGPTFFPLSSKSEDPGDPTLALVNGQIDISSIYRRDPNKPGFEGSHETHHQFFTTDLQFVGKRVLSDTKHIHLSSMIVVDGITNFVTNTELLGDIVVMQYDKDWNYLGGKTIKQKAATPEGVAFDGTRFYVSYLDNSLCTNFPCYQNVHLAAFDSDWNLLEDVAVTSFTPSDHKQTSRPSLTLWNGRIYVCYDQTENEMFTPGQDVNAMDVHAHVKMYELTNPGQ
jgi:hypothetical protein